MKEILAPIFVACVLTLGVAAPSRADVTTVRQGEDYATVLDDPGTHRVRIHDSQCDGKAIRVEAVLSDYSRYTMWNFGGCGQTRIAELNKRILSYRLCEVDRCTQWKDT